MTWAIICKISLKSLKTSHNTSHMLKGTCLFVCATKCLIVHHWMSYSASLNTSCSWIMISAPTPSTSCLSLLNSSKVSLLLLNVSTWFYWMLSTTARYVTLAMSISWKVTWHWQGSIPLANINIVGFFIANFISPWFLSSMLNMFLIKCQSNQNNYKISLVLYYFKFSTLIYG